MRSKSHNTPFLNREVVGAVTLTLTAGTVAHEQS